MPKSDDIVIIISDDEEAQVSTKQQLQQKKLEPKPKRKHNGANMTDPILLDDDEMDWKYSSKGTDTSQPDAPLKAAHLTSEPPLTLIDASTRQSSTIQPVKGPTSSIQQASAQSVPSAPFSTLLQPKQEERLQLQQEIEEQLKLQQLRQLQQKTQHIKQQPLDDDETVPVETAQQTQQSSTALVKVASTADLEYSGLGYDSLTFSDLDPSRKDDMFGLGAGLREFITSKNVPEVSYPLEEPDWSFIADIDSNPDSIPAPWQPPNDSSQSLPTTSVFPEGMDLLEQLTRLDFYQASMHQYVTERHPKASAVETQGSEPNRPSSPVSAPSAITRTSVKRSTFPVKKIYPSAGIPTITSGVFSTAHNPSEVKTIQATLIQRLTTPYQLGMSRPYIPNDVWHGSNWEDWAQFTPSDLIHVPFTEAEDAMIETVTRKMTERKRRHLPSSIYADSEHWNELAVLLSGREPQDCRYRYMDLQKHTKNIFSKAQMVVRDKRRTNRWSNYYDLLWARSVHGKVSLPIYQSALWTNLHKRVSVGGGSGDASCLLLEHEPHTLDGFQLIAGSLCDDNPSYNMEGNLRLWRSSSGKIRQLKGHSMNVPSEDGGTQALWRTVHDVKTSRNKKLIFSASRDGNAKVWNMGSNKLLSTLSFHNGPVHQIAVMNEKEHVIATGSADGCGVIWVIGDKGRSGQGTTCETEMVDEMETCSVECLEFGHGASDKKLFMGYRSDLTNRPGWITAFDVNTAYPIYDITDMRGSVGCLEVSHSGKYILSGNDGTESGDQMLHLNDAQTGKSILMAQTGHLDVNCVCFSICDNYIASGSVANQISIFDIRKPSKAVYKFAHSDMNLNNGRFIAPDAGMGIAGMHWMNNNRILVTGGGDCTVKVWDVFGGNGLLKSYPASDPIICLTVNEELNVMAAGVSGSQGVVHIWQPS